MGMSAIQTVAVVAKECSPLIIHLPKDSLCYVVLVLGASRTSRQCRVWALVQKLPILQLLGKAFCICREFSSLEEQGIQYN